MMRTIYFVIAALMLSANAQADEGLNDPVNSASSTSAPAKATKPKELSLIEKIATFEEGKTTYSDVEKMLDKPNDVTVNSEGIKTVHYGRVINWFGKKTGSFASLFFAKNDVLIYVQTTQY